jgi:hypothetical protein
MYDLPITLIEIDDEQTGQGLKISLCLISWA